ncbi:MAG TPA: HAMP domain-containing sensor histidine kinase [Gemmataceae bacterium]|nr:HAMP domain-containing sensor histidine kinase [Gemmataceae bacterium]
MKRWFGGKRGGLLAFVAIALLVAGGLGWVTAAALRLEQEQLEAKAEAELHAKLRLALWRLDSFMFPELAREASRPFAHYSAIYIPAPTFDRRGKELPPGSVWEVSPLLTTELPDWMVLHFSTAEKAGWWSPEILSDTLKKLLKGKIDVPQANETQKKVLKELEKEVRPNSLFAMVCEQQKNQLAQNTVLENKNNDSSEKNILWVQQNPTQQSVTERNVRGGVFNYQENAKGLTARNDASSKFYGNLGPGPNGESLLLPGSMSKSIGETVTPGPMTAFWVKTEKNQERMIIARPVQVGSKQVVQGIALDWEKLQKQLVSLVDELFPEAQLQPMRDVNPPHPERTMTALPVELDPGPIAPVEADWTPLRIGLALAWVAALIALAAVGLGGWSLIDLSQRRVRFVSTVTHELRTPLTTLRLYLDMLTGGMVQDEKVKDEYLHTLNAETDRLNRLVGNVLDFSRLENQQPRLEKTSIQVADLLERLRDHWNTRCKDCGKELIVENFCGPDADLVTDVNMVQQVLGNLIDNACKYSQSAEDHRLWVRAKLEGSNVLFEVEDRGPGVPNRERRSIFRPFRRGRDADVIAGGVGLGLALARRWAGLLGGCLSLSSCQGDSGACFCLELPR